MITWSEHLIILPILIPLVAGAVMLLFDERKRSLKAAIGMGSVLSLLAVTLLLLHRVDAQGASVAIYRIGNWATPFGILLVIDRLAAMMIALTTVLALAALLFSLARWQRAGAHYHTLFQFFLVGLNGAFLTGDLFNLFVFFEVLLAASYGLVLHGSEVNRVRAGLHYIAINLLGSMLLLTGISLVYGVTGTLNMADLAVKVPDLAGDEKALLEAGAGILGVAFLIKAGMWPLSFWLPTTYTAASTPVAAIFAVMSKVGIYVILRLWLLIFGPDSGTTADFGGEWLLFGGMMTLVFGSLGVLASQAMSRLAGFSVLVSSGTLLAVIATGNAAVISGALYYLVSSTLAIAAFFLLIELVERGREPGADVFAVTMEAFGDDFLDEEEEQEIGTAVPATMAMLGVAFLGCALILSGLPPLSGFIAKFAMLTAILNPVGLGVDAGGISAVSWTLVALLILSGLATLIATTRAGIRTLWIPREGSLPSLAIVEIVPVAFLLALCVAIMIAAEPVMQYMDETALFLHSPPSYAEGVLGGSGQEGDTR